MKVFISADIEGVTGTTTWNECELSGGEYARAAAQMTKEVIAVCEGAIAAGADQIVIKDAHDTGTNINISELPENAEIIRSWSGHPYSMVEGIDSSFDAVMFVGYHSGASKSGNPLSHTTSGKPHQIRINGEIVSEFMLYSYAAALEGVPTVFLAGDKMLCDDNKNKYPALMSVAVKDGQGGMTKSLAPAKSLKLIRETAEKALKQNLALGKIELPKEFEVEVCYKEQKIANKMSYYPGVTKINSNTIGFKTTEFIEVLRMFQFVL